MNHAWSVHEPLIADYLFQRGSAPWVDMGDFGDFAPYQGKRKRK